MRYVFVILTMLMCRPAIGQEDLVLPTVDFAATAVHQAGALQTREELHYSHGKLRIDRSGGLSSTILDLTTQSQYLLMANHTYLVLPMDDELFRRYIARNADLNGARKIGKDRVEGMDTIKYAFGEDGALDAAGSYWLTNTGIMVRREYEDGVFGQNIRHLEFLTNVTYQKQPSALFSIPVGYSRAK